jgi:hypothetical protein
MPDIKLYPNNHTRDPDHIIDQSQFPGPPPTILHVAQTGKYYTAGYIIAGSGGDLAYFEALLTEVNFAVPAFKAKSPKDSHLELD